MKILMLALSLVLYCGIARGAGPLIDGLTADEKERVEAVYDEVRKSPEMREAIETYNAARKAYLDDRQKFPNDRDVKVSLAYRKASKEFETVTGKALIAKDASLAPLVEKATEFKYRPRTKNEGETIVDSDDPRNKAMRSIKDVPGLPRVLLIGDSISIGYTPEVRELLKGKANVHRIPQNGGATDVGLENMEK
ncbi:MAG TPA: hypothetical protein VHV77_13690, partial [Pirellulales bacterium]|nr:hypothetical protein [Pirellulales bacterium]